MKTITVNGEKHSYPDDMSDRMLIDFLREDLQLYGTKNGCGIGACGACTVLVNNQPRRSCVTPLGKAEGLEVLTIEGMEDENGEIHPLQQAFIDAGAIQCGFCTPGMVMTAHAFLLKNGSPSREEIRKALAGNLCRCTGYQQIVDAIEMAAVFYRK